MVNFFNGVKITTQMFFHIFPQKIRASFSVAYKKRLSFFTPTKSPVLATKKPFFVSTIIIAFFLNLSISFAQNEPVTEISLAPLHGEISISFVTLNTATSWTTAPTSALRGRREINIYNPSDTVEIYLSGVSPSSVYRTLSPKQDATFKASSELHIFMKSTGTVCVEITEIK